MKTRLLSFVIAAAVLAGTLPAASQPSVTPLPGAMPQTTTAIEVKSAQVGGQQIRYLQAGSGPIAIVLLHGWPESSHEWRHVIPRLAGRYTVIAPDLRGIGGTSTPSDDFRKASLAHDVHGLVAKLGLRRVVVIGHDIGGMVAYAYARQYPRETLGIGVLDVPLPGLAPWDAIRSSPHAWHFEFNDQKPLAEQLVSGRQALYFRFFINSTAANPSAITDKAVAAYAAAYASPERLRAGFGFYRAFPEDEAFNKVHAGPLEVPILLAGADHSMGRKLLALEQQSMRALGAQHPRRDHRKIRALDRGGAT